MLLRELLMSMVRPLCLSRKQISRARYRGAQSARGRYLVFLDANTLLSGVIPLALFSKSLCRFWYERKPEVSTKGGTGKLG